MALLRLLSSSYNSPSDFYSRFEELHLSISELLNNKYGLPFSPRQSSGLALAIVRIDKELIIQKNQRGHRFIDEDELIA